MKLSVEKLETYVINLKSKVYLQKVVKMIILLILIIPLKICFFNNITK